MATISMSYHKFSNLGEKFNSDLQSKVMREIDDKTWNNHKCNCDIRTKKADGTCLYEGLCRKAIVVYELKCSLCGCCYVGKTQRYFKTRTGEHFGDVWKVIETGRKKFGPNWKGSGGYAQADAFAIHFAQHCRDARNSNEVRAKLKEIIVPTIIWQGDQIRRMKSTKTMQCKLCMMERREILHRF
jgi:hypothetical protein